MEQHWSKDYIEHLRTAHFTLILLCTAGIIIALVPGRAEISPAHQQLDQIRSLVANWDPKFLQAPARKDSHDTFLPVAAGLRIGNQTISLRLKPEQPLSFVTLDTRSNATSKTDCDHDPDPEKFPDPSRIADSIAAPTHVQDFKELWDALSVGATLHQPVWIPGKAFVRQLFPTQPLVQAVLTSPSANHASDQTVSLVVGCLFPSDLNAIRDRDKDIAQGTQYQFHGFVGAIVGAKPSEYVLYLPVTLEKSSVDGQTLLFRNTNQAWYSGKFDASFRDLSDALKHADLKSLTWMQAVSVVTDQESRAPSESFEAFGMKLPATASAYGALLIILGLQWYLWAQIYEFRRKLKASHDVPDAAWISLYDSAPARALTLTSMFLLPVLAVAALALRGAHSHVLRLFSWPVSAMGLLLSATLALATYRAMPRPGTAQRTEKAAAAASQ